jgi:hypothetical protein
MTQRGDAQPVAVAVEQPATWCVDREECEDCESCEGCRVGDEGLRLQLGA